MTMQKFNIEFTGVLEDMITEAIFCSNLPGFAEQAKRIIAYAGENSLNLEEVLGKLFESIEGQYLLDLEDSLCQCLKEDCAVRMYLYADWNFYRKQSGSLGNTRYIEKLLSEISHNAARQTDDKKAEHIVNEVLQLIRANIDILAVMPENHSINIAFVESPETRYEGYMTGHMPTSPNRLYHQIMVSTFADNMVIGDTLYAFIKAIGSVYLFALTGSLEKMPKGFSAIQKIFTPKLDSEMGLFAECFAMALCINSELREYDMQSDIPLAVKQQVYEYMIGLGSRWSPTQFHIKQTKLPS